MDCTSGKEAKDSFGRLNEIARVAPIVIEKDGQPVVVVVSVEENERLKAVEPEKAGA